MRATRFYLDSSKQTNDTIRRNLAPRDGDLKAESVYSQVPSMRLLPRLPGSFHPQELLRTKARGQKGGSHVRAGPPKFRCEGSQGNRRVVTDREEAGAVPSPPDRARSA